MSIARLSFGFKGSSSRNSGDRHLASDGCEDLWKLLSCETIELALCYGIARLKRAA
jgi:hypothetical protein